MADGCEAAAGKICWRDADQDGYGDQNQVHYSCYSTCPQGWVPQGSRSDCNDSNKTVNPGQTRGFDYPLADGGWDYNCNGVIDKVISVSGTCTGCYASPGYCVDHFIGPVANCGVTAPTRRCCMNMQYSCYEQTQYTSTQTCR